MAVQFVPWSEPLSRYFQTAPVETSISGAEMLTGSEVYTLPRLSRDTAVNRWTPPTTLLQVALKGAAPSVPKRSPSTRRAGW